MSLDHLPVSIEQGVQRFADERHMSHDEALVKLIETGLSVSRRAPIAASKTGKGKKPGELLIGLFSSPEDAAIFDEATVYSRELRETERLRDVWL